jgi:hypothetical protein
MANPYETLGVAANASQDDIRKAAKESHPIDDVVGSADVLEALLRLGFARIETTAVAGARALLPRSGQT